MKKFFTKNHMIIASLVIMIAVAAYLNFTADETLETMSKQPEQKTEAVLEEIAVHPEEDMNDIENVGAFDDIEDTEELDDLGDINTIGEAVLTSVTAKNFSSAAKLEREQARAKDQELLTNMLYDESLGAQMQQQAMDQLVEMSSYAQKELAAETLLEAKGYPNSVVSINNGTVDVVICLEELTETQKAQIEDIVTRKTDMMVDQMIINTLNQ